MLMDTLGKTSTGILAPICSRLMIATPTSLPFAEGCNLAMDAVILALGQHACQSGPWYAPLKELESVSKGLCRACRGIPVLRTNVTCQTSRSLWAPLDDGDGKLSSLSRVPTLRAHSVVWWLSGIALVEESRLFGGCALSATWSTLHNYAFSVVFGQGQDGAGWPVCLQKLTMIYNLDHTLGDMRWLAPLQEVHFGCQFNQPITDVQWPASRRHLEFGDAFNRDVTDVRWPALLEQVGFGAGFNRPIYWCALAGIASVPFSPGETSTNA